MASVSLASEGSKRPFYPKKRFKTSSGVLLEHIFFDRGRPRTLVFVNGWSLKLSSWKSQMHQFPDYNLLFLNNRGHGDVSLGASTKDTFLSDCADDLGELLDHLGVGRVHFVAHSMGALIAVESITRRPCNLDVESLTFVNPAVGNPLDTFPLAKLVRPLLNGGRVTRNEERVVASLKLFFNSLTNPFLLRLYHSYFRIATGSKVSFQSFRKFIMSILDIHARTFVVAGKAMIARGGEIGEKFSSLGCPVLAITGDNDFLLSPKSLDILRERVPHAELEVFPKSTHFPQAERPSLFNSRVSDFYASLE